MEERQYNPVFISTRVLSKSVGVYQLRNTLNGNIYIGSSKNLGSRIRQHFSDLRRGKHHCSHLQHAFNKYGESVFTYEIIEECDVLDRVDLEQYWIDRFLDTSKLYNSALDAHKTATPKRGKFNHKAHAIICLETQAIFKTIAEGSRNYNICPTVITKVCKAKKGTAGGLHWLYLEDYRTIKHSELRKIMAFQSLPLPVVHLESRTIYSGVCEAGERTGINKGNISLCCEHKRHSADHQHFVYLSEFQNMTEVDIANILNYTNKLGRATEVQCVETGVLYQSTAKAMEDTGAERHQIAECCKGLRQQTSNGLHFRYV